MCGAYFGRAPRVGRSRAAADPSNGLANPCRIAGTIARHVGGFAARRGQVCVIVDGLLIVYNYCGSNSTIYSISRILI